MFYIVATPIGNLGDITYRAVEVLRRADIILAEDTRRSAVLMKEYGITAPMLSYQKYNERARAGEIIEKLKDGKNVALVSDAGMPLVSDPGSVLLGQVISEKLKYTVLSGPCAAVTAAVLSGMDLQQFCMVGFLPDKNVDRERLLNKFCDLQCTLIFYVSPHALESDLTFLHSRLGSRRAVLVREISKIYEQAVPFVLGEMPDCPIRGEMVLVTEGARPKYEKLCSLSEKEHVRHYTDAGLSKKDAMKRAAADRGVSKSVIYSAVNKNEE